MAKNTIDFTTGNIAKPLIAFSIPLFLGNIFQQFYSMVDTVIVGKFLGVHALAGVGSTGAISFMIIGFCTGICAGFPSRYPRASEPGIMFSSEGISPTAYGYQSFLPFL